MTSKAEKSQRLRFTAHMLTDRSASFGRDVRYSVLELNDFPDSHSDRHHNAANTYARKEPDKNKQ